jgi:hypothetical protein
MLSRTDLSLVLSAFGVLLYLVGTIAALVLVAFLAGWLVRDCRDKE